MSTLLHHEDVAAAGSKPRQWLLVLHGIYGSGRNWMTIARKLTERRPELGVRLVDLRGHGRSPLFDTPHTLAATADDVCRLMSQVGPAFAVVGHSFGGKVAMELGAGVPEGLQQVWVVDASPEPRAPEGRAWQVLTAARAARGPFKSRQHAIAALEEYTIPPAIAAWFANNLNHDADDQFRWRIDLDVMELLLLDFFAHDAWPMVEAPPDDLALHFVKAEQSDMLSSDVCRRINEAGQKTGRTKLHRLPGGHWVNADNPTGLVALLAEKL